MSHLSNCTAAIRDIVLNEDVTAEELMERFDLDLQQAYELLDYHKPYFDDQAAYDALHEKLSLHPHGVHL